MKGSISWLNSIERASREVNDGWDLADIEGEIRRLAEKYELVWGRITDSTGTVWFVEPNGDKVVWEALRPVKDGIW